MTAPRRPAALPLVSITAAILAILSACGPAATPAPTATPSPAPSLTPVPGGPSGPAASPVLGPTAGPPTTTEVQGFGQIFDSLPPSFPKLLGATPAETGMGPTSGAFAADMEPKTASDLILMLLRSAGWSVETGSPLEDGTVVLDATHEPAGCKAQVRFTPVSGSLIMSVLYGASCPFS
ncbi:MAG: hypothetical protein E6I26_13850 [Chloroflexi bacterium]|nr:MAG: hypothetical protein E6I26_13850 [Chloroflexota bacterium]